MEIFKQLKGIFIIPSEESDSFADYIDLLIERLQTAYRVEDKIEALKAISTFAKVKKYKIDVGAKCIEPLVETLENNPTSFELVILSLECLRHIVSAEDSVDEDEELDKEGNKHNPPSRALLTSNQTNVEIQFTEIFMKNVKNLAVIIKFLEEYDFGVRFAALNLFETLVINAHKLVQAAILKIENGLSKILDLLGDSREIIRNETLVSLVVMAKGNPELQKIMAFENGFDLVLDILRNEDYSNGGVVSQDCLTLLLHLLRGNPSNQILFVEQGYMSKLCPFFDSIHQEDLDRDFVVDLKVDADKNGGTDITADKLGNLMLMLEVLRVFVSPTLPPTMVVSSQRSVQKCGLLQKLTDNILMASGIPHDVLTEAIFTTAEIIHGCRENQDYFSAVMAPSNPPRSLVAVLLMSMLNEKKPLDLRYAILYFFQSYLSQNDTLQNEVIQTLLSPSGEVSVGRILLTGLFSSSADTTTYPITPRIEKGGGPSAPLVITEGMSTWFAAVALSHALNSAPTPNQNDSPPGQNVGGSGPRKPIGQGVVTNKEQLLRVRLASGTGISKEPGSQGSGETVGDGNLMKSALDFLKKTKNLHSKIGAMIFLSTWLTDCPKAVKTFLSTPENIPYLVAQINETGQVSGNANYAYFDVNATTYEAQHQLLFSVLQSLSAFTFGLCVLFNDNTLPDFKTENLKAIINKRLGVENYVNKLTQLQKSSALSRLPSDYTTSLNANSSAALKYEDFVLDSEFIKIMTFYETFILKLFEHKNLKKDLKFDQIDFVTKKFEDRLKDKELHIEQLNQSCQDYKHQLQYIATKYEELNTQLKVVNEQNQAIIKHQHGISEASVQVAPPPPASYTHPHPPGYGTPYPVPPPQNVEQQYHQYYPQQQQQQHQQYHLVQPAYLYPEGQEPPPTDPQGQNFYLNGQYYDSYHQNFTLTTVSAGHLPGATPQGNDPNARAATDQADDGNISVISEEASMTTRMNDHRYRLLSDENEHLKQDKRELREALERLQKEQEGFLILIEEYEKRLDQSLTPPTPLMGALEINGQHPQTTYPPNGGRPGVDSLEAHELPPHPAHHDSASYNHPSSDMTVPSHHAYYGTAPVAYDVTAPSGYASHVNGIAQGGDAVNYPPYHDTKAYAGSSATAGPPKYVNGGHDDSTGGDHVYTTSY